MLCSLLLLVVTLFNFGSCSELDPSKLKCYSCSDMNLPYGNDHYYVDPEYTLCNHGNGKLIDCFNGTCMASVGEGGRKFIT